MDAKHICVGKDFHFGKDRGGDIHTLERFQKKYGYELVTVPKLYDDGQVISSTNTPLMDQGKMRKVNELLERPFFVQGYSVSWRSTWGERSVFRQQICLHQKEKTSAV